MLITMKTSEMMSAVKAMTLDTEFDTNKEKHTIRTIGTKHNPTQAGFILLLNMK